MSSPTNPPILNHALEQPSGFTAQSLMDDVRRARQIPTGAIPHVCILDFDGDLTDSVAICFWHCPPSRGLLRRNGQQCYRSCGTIIRHGLAGRSTADSRSTSPRSSIIPRRMTPRKCMLPESELMPAICHLDRQCHQVHSGNRTSRYIRLSARRASEIPGHPCQRAPRVTRLAGMQCHRP